MGKVADRLVPNGAPRGARYLVYALLAMTGAGLLLLIWGLIEPYLVEWREVRARIDYLPEQWRGRRVVAFGDMQVGSLLSNNAATRRIVDRLLRDRPDVVVLLGDFVYKGAKRIPEQIEEAVRLVAPLAEAGIPVFAVLGNHDYQVTNRDPSVDGRRANNLVDALETVGIKVLENQAVPVTTSGTAHADGDAAGNRIVEGGEGELYIVGIRSHEADKGHPQEALDDVPAGAPRFVVVHHQQSFLPLPARSAPVAVAGHTHGGQVRLPGVPKAWYKKMLNVDQVHLDGWADGYGQPGNHLYINRGIGFAGPPIRINARPEVTVFVLEPARGAAA